jgi:prophage antirepressor-like protein
MKNIFETLDENYILFDKIKINIIIDYTDKIWFECKELLNTLEYKDTKDAMKIHIDKDDKIQLKNINHSNDIKQHPNTIYINESDLYKLMFRSKMKKAKLFSKWVTNDVLPSIRKYGKKIQINIICIF